MRSHNTHNPRSIEGRTAYVLRRTAAVKMYERGYNTTEIRKRLGMTKSGLWSILWRHRNQLDMDTLTAFQVDLMQRRMKVAELVHQGFRSSEIAKMLYTSTRTIERDRRYLDMSAPPNGRKYVGSTT